MKKIHLLFFSLILSTALLAQNGHQITIKIKGFKAPSMILTSYFGNKIRLVDTAKASQPGVFVFEGNKKLPGGIYMAVSPKKQKLFEFVINNNQHFTLETDTANYALHMRVENSRENTLFFQYMQFNEKQYRKSKTVVQKLEKTKKGSSEFKALKHQLDSLKSASEQYRNKLADQNPKTFVAVIFRAMNEPENKLSKQKSEIKKSFYHLKNHYWDDFALNDPRLFRTPLYDKRVGNYFQHFVPMQPDSVDHAIDQVIARARPCSECVSYLVWRFTMQYQNPKYMGFDKVFVHMVNDYFEKESIANTTPSILKLLKKRADALSPLLLGKKAPELVLMDTTGNFVGFRSLPNRFTLLLFWDYKCSICKREIKELVPLYNKYAKKYDLAVYAININPDLKNWKKAVHDRKLPWIDVNGTRSVKGDYTKTYDIHGTPQLFLLDNNKKIIAKQFSVNQLKMILDEYLKTHKIN